MQIINTRKLLVVALPMTASVAFLTMSVMTRQTLAQDRQKTSALVVRVAVFSNGQGRLEDYRDFVHGHLFPTLRSVPGYIGTFLGHDANSGQLISLSFWRGEADAAAGEEAVGHAVRALPQGSAPRPSKVEKYVVEYRDIMEPLSK
jgi:heme-degrading monooxygenase HmoA